MSKCFPVINPHLGGNLHTHSTVSDGRLDPKKVVDLYQKMGYDFLAFTEHERFSWWQEFCDDNFLILPGIETGAGATGPHQCHHVVGIAAGHREARHIENYYNHGLHGLSGAQKMIADLNSAGYLTIYCHPDWPRQTFAEIKELKGFAAIEVYNHGCQLEDRTGFGTYYWDSFLRQGLRIWGIATDDSHQQLEDYGGGWVVVNAASLDGNEILQALKNGQFYSSTGPSIEAYGRRGEEVYIRCSSAREIHFIAYERRGRRFHC